MTATFTVVSSAESVAVLGVVNARCRLVGKVVKGVVVHYDSVLARLYDGPNYYPSSRSLEQDL